MAFEFRYPASGGTGAAAGGNLVTACGTFDPFPEGGTYTIKGKIYAGTPGDATPPSDASLGTCVVSGTSHTWHFNGCSPPLSGCTSGDSRTMRVWLTSSAVSSWSKKDCSFTVCESGTLNCVPDCPESTIVNVHCIPVIQTIATRYFVVTPTAEVADLLGLLGQSKSSISKLAVQLAYDEDRSTLGRAIWAAKTGQGEQLVLEVTSGSCCQRALLARVRVEKQSIETLERWCAECFDVLDGGPLQRVDAEGRRQEGSVLVHPPGGAAAAPPQESARARRGRGPARRTRRGRR